jgi:hypothetical protein
LTPLQKPYVAIVAMRFFFDLFNIHFSIFSDICDTYQIL